MYSEWCEVCVAARGTGAQHQDQRRNSEGAKYGSTPVLALTFSRSRRIAATAVPSKGATEFGVTFFARFIEKPGVNFSDNKPEILAFEDAAARA